MVPELLLMSWRQPTALFVAFTLLFERVSTGSLNKLRQED